MATVRKVRYGLLVVVVTAMVCVLGQLLVGQPAGEPFQADPSPEEIFRQARHTVLTGAQASSVDEIIRPYEEFLAAHPVSDYASPIRNSLALNYARAG